MSVVYDDDDLTTDAVPSAPRNDPENDTENHVRNPKPKTGRKTKSHAKQQIPNTGRLVVINELLCVLIYAIFSSAFANVINITNSNSVHIGPNVVINPIHAPPKSTKSHVVTREIMALFDSKERVTRNDLSFVSRHIDDKWKDVGKALLHSEGELNAFQRDYEDDGFQEVNEKIF